MKCETNNCPCNTKRGSPQTPAPPPHRLIPYLDFLPLAFLCRKPANTQGAAGCIIPQRSAVPAMHSPAEGGLQAYCGGISECKGYRFGIGIFYYSIPGGFHDARATACQPLSSMVTSMTSVHYKVIRAGVVLQQMWNKSQFCPFFPEFASNQQIVWVQG